MPSTNEILLASNCQRCRKYFDKTGPVCAHCHLEELIIAYRLKLVAFKSKRKLLVSLAASSSSSSTSAISSSPSKKKGALKKGKGKKEGIDSTSGQLLGTRSADGDAFDVQEFDSERVDGAFIMIIQHLRAYAVRFTSSRGMHEDEWSDLQILRDAAVSECRRCESMKKELLAMTGLWQRYMALLKVHDEVDQGRRRIGLVDNAVSADVLSGNNLYAHELPERYQRDYHEAVGKDILLRESIGQLMFYKNQEMEARLRLATMWKLRTEKKKKAAVALAIAIDKCSLVIHEKSASSPHTPSLSSSEQVQVHASVNANVDTDLDPDQDNLTCIFCRENLAPDKSLSVAVGQSDSLPLRSVESVVCLPCAHNFHGDCVRRWLQKHRACPVCKRPAVFDDCVNVDMSSGINSSTGHDATKTKLRVKLSQAVSREGVGVEELESSVDIRGQWGSKIDALVAELLQLLMKGGDTGEGEKVIVFSQWTEMLQIVSEALQANNINFSLCMDRAKDFGDLGPLQRFKSNTDTRVLLMPLHLGAEGLDLVQASHLFLLEPLLNPSLESQAVNRIHRIGQTRTTHVHKFAVKDTVEELILKGQQLKIINNLPIQDIDTDRGSAVGTPSKGGKKKSRQASQQDQDFLTLQNIQYLLGISQS